MVEDFHTQGPTAENVQSPSLVLVRTVVAAQIEDDFCWNQC